MMKNHYYAEANYYGSETSLGFSNTWYAIQFDSQKQRDEYIKNSISRDVRIISAKEVKKKKLSIVDIDNNPVRIDWN